MRLSTLLFALPLVLTACAETPRCVDRGTPERPRIEIECNAGKVPVCGDDPEALYNDQGGLRPVPDTSVADGICPDGIANCRTRPVCQQEKMKVVCNDGTSPVCVLGAINEIRPPRPMVDAGGGEDAGGETPDAGDLEDAGVTDAGGEDAGGDAGTADAGAN